MAKKDEVKEKVDTPALGAEGATDLGKDSPKDDKVKEKENLDETGNEIEDDEFEAPEWAVALLESNQAVIDSNAELAQSIEELKTLSKGQVAISDTEEVKPKVKVNEKAKYVVSHGRKFVDKDNRSRAYNEGDDVSKLSHDRLGNLLSQGIIEESK